MRYLVLLGVLAALSCSAAAAGWEVVSACWRPDENPWVKQQVWDGWIWSEGWPHGTQFWPEYFKPAGSLHVILQNNTSTAAALELTEIDGLPIGEVDTNPERAGRVVWRLIFPEKTEPGGWAECIVRLREKPARDVRLGFNAGNEEVAVSIPAKPARTRIELLSFAPRIDSLCVYVRALDGGDPKAGSVRLDLGEPVKCRWWPGPKGSGLAFAELDLKPAWELGSYHLVEVSLADGSKLAYPVRAWDSYFAIGLFGTIDADRIAQAKKRAFNTYVVGRENKLLDDAGLNYVVRWGVAEGRMRIPGKQSGTLFYNNHDEPDAHDAAQSETLPYMDRLGLNAELQVLPRYWEHVRKDSRTPSMVLTDNTYKPLNYYVYGQTSDVFCTDPYVPAGGDQVQLVAHSMECARDACAPCPVIATLWCTSMGERNPWNAKRRPPTPEEERLMTFYALGAGVKGVFYFADRDTPSGEELVSVVHNQPLWDEMGRINRDVKALAPYLAHGCPAGPPVETDKLWYRSLMCGPTKMVLIVVNKGHHIGYITKYGFAWHFPAKDVVVSLPLAAQFQKCSVKEVKDGGLVPAKADFKNGEMTMTLDVVDTARAFVISAE